jgi:hypothetical protein
MKIYTKIIDLSGTKRIPRLGKIRLGAKVEKKTETNTVEYPVELPFFVLPPEVGEKHGGKVSVKRAKELGVSRKDVLDYIKNNSKNMAESLPVMIPVEDVNQSFPQAYKMYGSGIGLKCIGNGEEASLRTGSSRQWQDVKCPCKNMKTDENPKGECTRTAHLQVILPDVSAGGVYQIDIGSINSIIDINSGIEYVKALIGRVAMVPLILKRVPTETHHDGKKQIHYTCQLTFDYSIEKANLLRIENERILSHQKVLELEAPAYISPEEKPIDIIIEQSPETIAKIDELRKLGENKKLKRGEANAIKTAIDDNNDTAIDNIYDAVKSRIEKDVKGTTAGEMAKVLKEEGQAKNDIKEMQMKSGSTDDISGDINNHYF